MIEAAKVKRRTPGERAHAATVRLNLLADYLQAEPCSPSVAMFFLLMARRLTIGVKAYPHASDPDKWCFRFAKNGLLEIDGAGRATWVTGAKQIRAQMDLVVKCAQERFERSAWYVPGPRTETASGRSAV